MSDMRFMCVIQLFIITFPFTLNNNKYKTHDVSRVVPSAGCSQCTFCGHRLQGFGRWGSGVKARMSVSLWDLNG